MCLNAAGVAAPKDRILDGRDPVDALNGDSSPHKFIVSQLGGAIALREGRWKIVRSAANSPWELYDLETNAIESFNLAAKRPKDLERLVALHTQWEQDVKRDASAPERYEPRKN
jgi:arylsulfatase A-like enzyme